MSEKKMITGTTESGFKFSIDADACDDMEIVDALYEMDHGNLSESSFVVRRLLGEDQKRRLYDHARGKNGRVSSQKVMAELTDIFKRVGGDDAKNS